MLIYFSVISLIISSIQIFGILAIGGETENTAIMILTISIMQGIMGFVTYTIQNAALKYFSSSDEQNIKKFISRKIFINLIVFSFFAFLLIMAVKVNDHIYEAINNVMFNEKNKLFLCSLSYAALGIGFMIANTYLYTLYRYSNKLGKYELYQVVGNTISTIGLFYFLHKQDIENASILFTLRYVIPCIMAKEFYSLGLHNTNKDEKIFKIEFKKLIFGATIFKLMMPIDRIIIGSINSTSIIGFSVAQQVNSAFDILIGKTLLATKLNSYSRSLNQNKNINNHKEEFKNVKIIFILGLVYYLLSSFIIYLLGDNFYAKDYGLTSIGIYIILLIGQPLFSSASSYMNGLFYSNGKSEIAVLNGVITTIFGYLLKFLLIIKFGAYGIAIGISIQYAIAFMVLNLMILKGMLEDERL